MKTLIVEFQSSGHYPEYLKHVLHQINEEGIHKNFLIFLSPELKAHLRIFENTHVYKSIQFFDESLGVKYNNCANTKQMAKLIFEQIFKIEKEYIFDHVLFLNLNLVLRNHNIINPFKKLPFSFSGIYMNSPFRLRANKNKRLLRYKQEFPLKSLVKNKNCIKIWLLNDLRGFQYYKKWSSKISFIVDPVRIEKASSLNIYKYHDIAPEAVIFTQIGKLGVYKGTQNIADAINSLPLKLLATSHFLFIGRVNNDTEINILSDVKHRKNISLRNEFISDKDFSAYVEQSHVIIIANKNVENSSGVVNHCLANSKVVIAPEKGYYKEVFKNYKAVVSYNDDFTLKDAIEYTFKHYKSLQCEAEKYDSENYIKQNSSKKFAETIMDHII